MTEIEKKKKENVDENKESKAIRLALENSFEIQSEKLAKINERIKKLQGGE